MINSSTTDTPNSGIEGDAQTVHATLSPGRIALQRLTKHGSFWIGGGLLLLIIVAALAGPLLVPAGSFSQDIPARFTPPMWMAHGTLAHPLGTDRLGRDILARLLDGGRISLLIGFGTVIVSGLIGITLGLCAGYWGGKVDLIVNFILTIRLTIPSVLVALVVVAVIGNSLLLLITVIGALLWDRFVIVARSTTQQLVRQDFVIASQLMGSSTLRILSVEILPNIIGSLMVVATVEMAQAIILEAALSFLGLGVQPPLSSWGLMITQAKSQILFRPWMVMFPGAALVALVLAINLLGDALRDVMDPEGRA